MKDIKKTILTLVALLAVTTGAWAQGPWTSGDCTVTLSDGVLTVSGTGAMADYTSSTPWSDSDIKTIVIESGVTSIGEQAFSRCYYLESVSIPASVTSIGNLAFQESGAFADALTVSFAEGSTLLTIGVRAFYYANLTSIDIPNRVTSIGEQAFSSCSSLESVSIPASVTSISAEAFCNCGMLAKVYIYAPSLTTYGAYAFQDNADGRKIHVLSDAVDTYKAGWPAYAADIVGDLQPLASGPEVAWDKATKTGTFTMPGGNVTLEPEYYPQATLAFQGLTAAEDAAAKTEAPLAVVADGAVTGGTLMYYVATDKNFSQADAIALAETQWSADIPTAETIEAAGTYIMWYYIKGDAEHSDTDPIPLVVTLLPEPTYAVTFAEGTDPNEWTADPKADVKKGQTVTVTYTGAKKVIGVKAEKKAKAIEEPVADIVWDGTNVSDLHVEGNYLSYTKEGIKLSGNAEQVQAEWNNAAYLETHGMEFITMESGGFTFTAPTGKAFTKIEMKAQGLTGWKNVNLGTGWEFVEDNDNEIYTVTWKGSAASTVKLLKDADMFSGDFISSIAFYLSE